MPESAFEIRICNACGLRYPLTVARSPQGTRCPACLGKTRITGTHILNFETNSMPLEHPDPEHQLSVLLDNIRSAWNVGSILRTADGFGFNHAYLCGITPTPDNDGVKKTSLGAEGTLAWTYHKDAVKIAQDLRSQGKRIVALEENVRSIPLEKGGIESTGSVVLILGNEITGVDPQLLELCDEIYHIRMRGGKKSFNVAIAFGIAAYACRE